MKVKINVPSSLNDISLSQYQKFIRTTKDLEDNGFIERQMVGIFCNLSDELVNNITANSFDEIVNDLSKILNQQEFELIREVKYKGVNYGFIPNLEDITVGEQVDLDGYLKDTEKLGLALGVLYRPIILKQGGSYKIEDYNKEHLGVELDLPLDVALGASFFLQNLMKDLLNVIPNFIEDQVQADPKLLSLVENGGGIKTFMDSLRVTFSSLKMYQS